MDDLKGNFYNSKNSYRREYPKYNLKPFKWEIISKEESDLILKDHKKLGEIYMLLDLWDLHLIEKFEVSKLLYPVKFQFCNSEEEHNLLEYYAFQERFYDETSKAIHRS